MRILITGGTGSLGSYLARKWYAEGHIITILSRDPHKQEALDKELPNAVFCLSDITNKSKVERACIGQDIVIHAAALKQVNWGGYHPSEFTRVNVEGSIAVAEGWFNTHKRINFPGKALLISSDKAVQALNAYGSSKKMAEAVFRRSDYSVVRYGNVVESNGAFLKYWKKAIANNEFIILRQPEPTRFFLTLKDAMGLITDALRLIDDHNGIFVPHSLKAFSIWDVAKAVDYDKVKYEPLLPYEKKDEILVADGECAVQVSPLLAEIRPGWDYDPGCRLYYHSDSAFRMTGKQVLDTIGWESL